jgi:hypothetical protein
MTPTTTTINLGASTAPTGIINQMPIKLPIMVATTGHQNQPQQNQQSPPPHHQQQRRTISSIQQQQQQQQMIADATVAAYVTTASNININIPVQLSPVQLTPTTPTTTTSPLSTSSPSPKASLTSNDNQATETATEETQSAQTGTSTSSTCLTTPDANVISSAANASDVAQSEAMEVAAAAAVAQSSSPSSADNKSPSSNGGSGGSGGGICSVLLEVIEKLRDAETLSDGSKSTGAGSNGPPADQAAAAAFKDTNLKAAKKLKRKLKLDKNGNEIVKGPQKVKKPKVTTAVATPTEPGVVDANAENNGLSSEEKKLRKKRTSKKLCQLLQEKNELNNLMMQQQTQMEVSGLGANYETCASLSTVLSKRGRGSSLFNNSGDNSASECTIETSVVNSLYEDEDALLNKFDSSVSLTSRNNETDHTAPANAAPSDNGAELDHFSAAHGSSQLMTLQQQQQPPRIVNVNFACFRCLNLFNDLSLLGEHKAACGKLLDREELAARSACEDESIIYLCDLCAGGGLCSQPSAGLQFTCFNKLDSLIEHYKSDHAGEFASCLAVESTTSNASLSTMSSHSPAVSGVV